MGSEQSSESDNASTDAAKFCFPRETESSTLEVVPYLDDFYQAQ